MHVVGFLLFSLLCEATIISLKFTVACHSVVEREEKKNKKETTKQLCWPRDIECILRKVREAAAAEFHQGLFPLDKIYPPFSHFNEDYRLLFNGTLNMHSKDRDVTRRLCWCERV